MHPIITVIQKPVIDMCAIDSRQIRHQPLDIGAFRRSHTLQIPCVYCHYTREYAEPIYPLFAYVVAQDMQHKALALDGVRHKAVQAGDKVFVTDKSAIA